MQHRRPQLLPLPTPSSTPKPGPPAPLMHRAATPPATTTSQFGTQRDEFHESEEVDSVEQLVLQVGQQKCGINHF